MQFGGGDVDDVSNPEILNAAQVTYWPGFRQFVSVCNRAGTCADQCESST